jgi:thiamine-monophosphate kinase
MLNDIVENRLIASLVDGFRRSPLQRNGLHQTDAEIVQLNESCAIAVTTDCISEEVAAGLYTDPWLIGWMAVMANMSDLAAVGAQPIGMLISEILPPGYPAESLRQLQRGIRDACDACHTFLLGGDTNAGKQLAITGTAVGLCAEGKFLSRTGCHPGELLYATDTVGIGSAFALSVLLPCGAGQAEEQPVHYRPAARIREGKLLREFASSCMDTSDGVLATVDQLVRLNGLGFDLTEGWTNALHPTAAQMASERGIPDWIFLAGQHGEFELLFTIPERFAEEFNRRAQADGWQPLLLGQVTAEPGVRISLYGDPVTVDTTRIRNLAVTAGADAGKHLVELFEMDEEMRGKDLAMGIWKAPIGLNSL